MPLQPEFEPYSYPETYYAGAYWGPRRESPEQCAHRTATFLNHLAPCDPFLAHWYKPTRSRKEARNKYPLMPPDLPTLTELFRKGVNREGKGPVIEELGFSFWFGNGGGNYDRAGLRIHSGSYGEGNSNACVLSLPSLGRSKNADRIITASVLTSVVRCMALAWEPDWAIAMSHAYRATEDERDGQANDRPGWISYFARHRGTVPPLPAPVRIEHVGDQGTLIILTPERFTYENAEHVALARRVHELLVKAGLMEPIVRRPA
ncbi:immunity 52 family protein [Myxococcus eversor]|uniref:immunity 52 family protein n=1 Tax=Myxococcus eversor TaxID=2709661 RepID=UPI001F071A47|nr:immunity 52 family protein [Myxococcus eversor]